MKALFLGGPLDGQMLEPTEKNLRFTTMPDEFEVDFAQPLDGSPMRRRPEYTWHFYHLGNGIARHESVSEELLAQTIARWRSESSDHKVQR